MTTDRPAHPTVYRRVRHRVRSRVSERPAIYLPFARHKYPGPSPEVIGPTTELVIDGYTRSASTFAVYALQLAQPHPVRLAHHLHAPAQLIAAARRGVPALLVIRNPQAVVLSQVAREPDVALRDALGAYVRFHACLLPFRDRLVVADFAEVTGDFGTVIGRLNDRFGMSLRRFEHTEANVAECLRLVALRDSLSPALLGFESGLLSRAALDRELASRPPDPPSETGHAWMPSPRRDAEIERLRQQWQASFTGLWRRADELYASFVRSATAQETSQRRQEPTAMNGRAEEEQWSTS
ncbi:MAG: hypothetical protein ABR571_00235 [Jatrophihabitans sp.]|uniref:hypothetical protein n=1 Tax=Jatrophihabitans sp. TaxID=1932789 RepID=UPI003914458D